MDILGPICRASYQPIRRGKLGSACIAVEALVSEGGPLL